MVGAAVFPLFAPVALLNVAVLAVLRGVDVVLAAGTAVGLQPLARRRQRSRPPRWGVQGGPRAGMVDTVADAVVDEPWPALGRPFPRA